MKKKIGISFSEINFRNYWNWFEEPELKNDVELIELSFLKKNEKDIYSCDGFILTGGIDVNPSFYGGKPEYDNKPKLFEPLRDKFEEIIYNYSQKAKKPLLGICRGLQLVNVLQGGRLIQDLSFAGNAKHRAENGVDKVHSIKIERDSLLSDITNAQFGQVNSAHHQAIDTNAMGNNLVANAYCDSELIEGIEFKDKKDKAFMLCVQWHPERMKDKKSVFSEGIKKSFLEAVTHTK